MSKTVCLNKNYSTTRLLTKDKYESILFLPEGEGRKGEGGLRTQGYFKKSFIQGVSQLDFGKVWDTLIMARLPRIVIPNYPLHDYASRKQ